MDRSPAGAADVSTAADIESDAGAGGDSGGRNVSTTVEGDADSGDEDGIDADPALADQLDVLSARVDWLEGQMEDRSWSSTGAFDTALVHKVAHACLESEAISEDEELRILEGMLASEG